jgi:hypothetical protein
MPGFSPGYLPLPSHASNAFVSRSVLLRSSGVLGLDRSTDSSNASDYLVPSLYVVCAAARLLHGVFSPKAGERRTRLKVLCVSQAPRVKAHDLVCYGRVHGLDLSVFGCSILSACTSPCLVFRLRSIATDISCIVQLKPDITPLCA